MGLMSLHWQFESVRCYDRMVYRWCTTAFHAVGPGSTPGAVKSESEAESMSVVAPVVQLVGWVTCNDLACVRVTAGAISRGSYQTPLSPSYLSPHNR